MNKLSFLLVSCVFLLSNLAHSQLSTYNKEIFTESFDNSESSIFPIIINQESYIVFDKGDYFLNRKQSETDGITLSNYNFDLESYKIKTAFKLSPDMKKDYYIGLILNMSTDKSECIGIEFNEKLELRVRKILTNSSKYISGTEEKNGWIKNESIADNKNYNLLEIIFDKGIYTIYINNSLVNSYEIPEIKPGKMGFINGPNSQFRVDFISVFQKSEIQNNANNQLEQLESKIDNLNEQLFKKHQSLEQDFEQYKQNQMKIVEQKEKENQQLIDEKNKIVETAKSKANNYESTIKEKEAEIFQLKTDKSKLISEVSTINDLKLQIGKLNEKVKDYSNLQKENTGLNQKLAQQDEIIKENTILSQELKQQTISIESSETFLGNLKQTVNDLNKKIDSLESKNDKIKQQLSQLKNKNTRSEEQLSTCSGHINTLKKTNKSLANELDSIATALAKSNSIANSLKKNNEGLSTKVNALKSENNKLKVSNSEFLEFKNGFIEMEASHSKISKELKRLKHIEEDYTSQSKQLSITKALLKKSEKEIEEKTQTINALKIKSKNASELHREVTNLNSLLEQKTKLISYKENALKTSEDKYNQSIENENKILNQLNQSGTNTKGNITSLTIAYLKQYQSTIEQLNDELISVKQKNTEIMKSNSLLEEQIRQQKLVATQFAESYILEKQKREQFHNEILSYNMSNETTEVKDSVIFRVQLGIFDNEIDIEGLEDLTTIYTKNEQIIYISGKFINFKNARDYLMKMREKGFKDSFIVKF